MDPLHVCGCKQEPTQMRQEMPQHKQTLKSQANLHGHTCSSSNNHYRCWAPAHTKALQKGTHHHQPRGNNTGESQRTQTMHSQ